MTVAWPVAALVVPSAAAMLAITVAVVLAQCGWDAVTVVVMRLA